jgi:hypothetical protein
MGRLIPIDPASRSGRFRRAVNDLNYHGAFDTSGVSQTGIKSTYQVARKDSVQDPAEEYLC